MINQKYKSSLDRLPGEDLWAKMINSCESIKEFSTSEKLEAQQAFHVLKDVLGGSFLGMVFSKDHPIFFNLINVVGWTRRWIIWFANAIKSSLNYDLRKSIIKRILDPDKYDEALSVLNYADKLYNAGFNISIDEKSGNKIPDIKALNELNGESFIIEISAHKKHKREEKAFDLMRAISFEIFCLAPGMSYCGEIYKIVADKHLEEILRKIKDVVVPAKENNQFRCLHIQYVLDLAIAPKDDDPKILEWAEKHNTQPGQLIGPDPEVNHYRRLEDKVFKKQEQLPKDKPGVIIIDNNDIFRSRDYVGVISKIEDIAYSHDKLALLIVSGGYMGSGSNLLVRSGEHQYIRIKRKDASFDQYYIIKNKYSSNPLSPDSVDKIVQSLYIE